MPSRPAPFGRVLTAMVTPFTRDGALDLDVAQQLAVRLVDAGNDGLVLNGTTGEAPTTRGTEKAALVRAVVEAVGDRCSIVAGVGSNHTEHSEQMARDAAAAGADGVLVVTPYYNKPPQAGVVAHCLAVADAAGDLPVMLYDIPGRSAIAMETDTICRIAEHPRVVAMKDAKLDYEAAATVLSRTDLAWYSGQDACTLPFLAIGGVGVVGTSTHLTSRGTADMIAAFDAGDLAAARALHYRLLPAYTGIFRTQGVILVKAALRLTGLDAGPVRLPLVDATPDQVEVLRADLSLAGLLP
ncbi:MAG: dihydrodipicolinate synthase [Frankiales bacterium]|nr:dihydrodipicolinate synthase [Frankiales bacterium]